MSEPKIIFVEPPSYHYLRDKLFDLNDTHLNRDNSLLPFFRLKQALERKGIRIHTVDRLFSETSKGPFDFYSFGNITHLERVKADGRCRLRGFFVFEPPIVLPEVYRALPDLTASFETVFIHNTDGDGYGLSGVDRSRLKKYLWPQPLESVIEPYFSRQNREDRLVVINGSHRPRVRDGELYSLRIRAMAALARHDAVDLYGRGWDRWLSRNSLWAPYILNYRTLMKIYRGACPSKYEVLSRYRFSLCFENQGMNGYMTEKIFDCFYAGTIPIYIGAPDVRNYIPAETFIDGRPYIGRWDELWAYLRSLRKNEIEKMREAARQFMTAGDGLRFVHSLNDLIAGI